MPKLISFQKIVPRFIFMLFLLIEVFFPSQALAEWAIDFDPPTCTPPIFSLTTSPVRAGDPVGINLTGADRVAVVTSGLKSLNLFLDPINILTDTPLATSTTSSLSLTPPWSAILGTHTFGGSAIDNAGNITRCVDSPLTIIPAAVSPWIQTQNGDVHSNNRINDAL